MNNRYEVLLFVIFFSVFLFVGIWAFSCSTRITNPSYWQANGQARTNYAFDPTSVLTLNDSQNCYGYFITPRVADYLRLYPKAYVLNASANNAGLVIGTNQVESLVKLTPKNTSAQPPVYNFQLPGSFLESVDRGYYSPNNRLRMPILWSYNGTKFPVLQLNTNYDDFNKASDSTLCTTTPISQIPANVPLGYQVWIYGSVSKTRGNTLGVAMLSTPVVNASAQQAGDRPNLTSQQIGIRLINLDTSAISSTADLTIQFGNNPPQQLVSALPFGGCSAYSIVDKQAFLESSTRMFVSYRATASTPSVYLLESSPNYFIQSECYHVCSDCDNSKCNTADGTYLYTIVVDPDVNFNLEPAYSKYHVWLFTAYAQPT